MITREIYEKGQVVIPKEIRDRFGFSPGTEVAFEIKNNEVIVKRARSVAEEIMEMRKEDAIFTQKEIKKAIKEHREYLATRHVHRL